MWGLLFCNAREVNPDFVGPHALAKAYRMVADCVTPKQNRLETYNKGTQGVWGCRCFYCNTVCPMWHLWIKSTIKQEILANKDVPTAAHLTPQGIGGVKQGGWIDERSFGLQVVGDFFRDLKDCSVRR